MSSTEVGSDISYSPDSKKRKRDTNEEDLEIDLNAPEPPSKKALRKAKKDKVVKSEKSTESVQQSDSRVIGGEDVVPNQGKRSEYGIWIGNLSFTTTKQDLLNFMTSDTEHIIPKDDITRIHLPAGPVKFGKFQNKGFAYIDLANNDSLESALQLSEKLLGGRRVLIKNAKSFEGRPKDGTKEASGNPPSKRIFVGNLDFDTTVDDLEKHFGVCGLIQHTQMATFEDSRKCKGYAWIEFEQLSSGQAAMRGWVEEGHQADQADVKRSKQRIWLNKIKGRKLRMEYAEDKTTRYNKRYGKNATHNKADNQAPAIEEVTSTESDPKTARGERANEAYNSSRRLSQEHGGRVRKQRYADETVKKLTGAIVKSQGEKVTFD